jgi:hypothetical protein
LESAFFTPLNLPLRGETYFYFVFEKINFVSKEIGSFPSQLSYSVNESLSGVAVRDSFAGAKGQKHVAKRQSVSKETPYES